MKYFKITVALLASASLAASFSASSHQGGVAACELRKEVSDRLMQVVDAGDTPTDVSRILRDCPPIKETSKLHELLSQMMALGRNDSFKSLFPRVEWGYGSKENLLLGAIEFYNVELCEYLLSQGAHIDMAFLQFWRSPSYVDAAKAFASRFPKHVPEMVPDFSRYQMVFWDMIDFVFHCKELSPEVAANDKYHPSELLRVLLEKMQTKDEIMALRIKALILSGGIVDGESVEALKRRYPEYVKSYQLLLTAIHRKPAEKAVQPEPHHKAMQPKPVKAVQPKHDFKAIQIDLNGLKIKDDIWVKMDSIVEAKDDPEAMERFLGDHFNFQYNDNVLNLMLSMIAAKRIESLKFMLAKTKVDEDAMSRLLGKAFACHSPEIYDYLLAQDPQKKAHFEDIWVAGSSWTLAERKALAKSHPERVRELAPNFRVLTKVKDAALLLEMADFIFFAATLNDDFAKDSAYLEMVIKRVVANEHVGTANKEQTIRHLPMFNLYGVDNRNTIFVIWSMRTAMAREMVRTGSPLGALGVIKMAMQASNWNFIDLLFRDPHFWPYIPDALIFAADTNDCMLWTLLHRGVVEVEWRQDPAFLTQLIKHCNVMEHLDSLVMILRVVPLEKIHKALDRGLMAITESYWTFGPLVAVEDGDADGFPKVFDYLAWLPAAAPVAPMIKDFWVAYEAIPECVRTRNWLVEMVAEKWVSREKFLGIAEAIAPLMRRYRFANERVLTIVRRAVDASPAELGRMVREAMEAK